MDAALKAFMAAKEALTSFSHIPSWTLQQASWQMPLTLRWVLYYSNSLKTSGALLHIFAENSNWLRRHIVPLTGNYWQSKWRWQDIYLAIKQFQHILEGHQFYVLADHKPLLYFVSSSPNWQSPRQIRHLNFISQFILDIYVTFKGV